MTTTRPNIVFILTDQQYAGAMSCVGNPYLNTPAMDSLAQRGMRFDKAYTTFPLCTPARASMITGRYPHEIGVFGNDASITDDARQRSIGHLLSQAGYDCGWGGKWHLPEIEIPDGYGFRKICGFNDIQLGPACADFIREDREQPFFLVASFDNPHNICEWSRKDNLPWGPIPDIPRVDECPNLPPNFAIPPFEPTAIRQYQRRTPIIDFVSEFTTEHWRRLRFAYFRLIEKVDAQIGLILDALRETSLMDNTVVIFSSDHGDMHGARQLIQKTVLYEESVRVPLIIAAPGTGSSVDTHIVSNGIDLLPTICDYAGVTTSERLSGRSLRPLVEDRNANHWREFVVAETEFEAISCPARMVRSDRYKYIVYRWGQYREELFDLEIDPFEHVNLAVEMRYKAILEQHRAYLRNWCLETNDDFGHHYSHPNVPFSLPGKYQSDSAPLT